MSIDPVMVQQIQTPKPPQRDLPLIEPDEIKAILYLGIRGEIVLPLEKHEVDILA